MPPFADRFGTALSGFVLPPRRRRLVWLEDPWARSLLFRLGHGGTFAFTKGFSTPRLRFVNAPHSRQRVAAMNKTGKDIKNNLCSGWGQVSLHKRKSCFQCLMPNVSLNKKKQRSLLHIKPDNDMHARHYIKKTLTLFQSVHVIHLHVIHSHVMLYKLTLRNYI